LPVGTSPRDALLTSCVLTGQDFPELAAWRREMEEEREKRGRGIYSSRAPLRAPRFEDEEEYEDDWFDEPPVAQPAVRAAPKVGRNDPCPCGSGKKFKKCCLNKEESL